MLPIGAEAAVRRGSIKKMFFKNFAKFTGKQIYRISFFDKVAIAGCNFIKKETPIQMFSCEFCEIFKNTFLPEHLQTTASVDTNHSFKTQQRSHISCEIT